MDDEVAVDVYDETGSLTFTRNQLRVPIFEYTIICDVIVSEEITGSNNNNRGRRGGAAKQASLKITR